LSQLAKQLAGKKIEVAHKHRWVPIVQNIDAADYIDQIENSEYYWRHFPLRDFGLSVSLPRPGRRDTIYFDYGWIGPAGTVQTFHQDNHDDVIVNHNVFAQVIGRKYVAVASPSDSAFLQQQPLTAKDSRHSRALPYDEDTRRNCPTLAEAVLEAGDMLYIPPRYWHFMESCSTSMSISRWWFEARIAQVIYASALGMKMRRSHCDLAEQWASDLEELGGFDILDRFLSEKSTLAQLRLVLGLASFYGKEILNVGRQRGRCPQL
jgi:hypothetical protein